MCEQDIDECKLRMVDCGRAGTCENMPGSYRCICDTIKGKCGYQCDLNDPCETDHPCEHGVCHSKCTDMPDYVCACEDEYVGKNCTELKVSCIFLNVKPFVALIQRFLNIYILYFMFCLA